MARITQDREDLLREASALTPRVMLAVEIHGAHREVFAGFRGESLSVYLGASPVYHFNAAGELRRAFVDDNLLKADAGQLVCSVRKRTADQVVLASTQFAGAEQDKFMVEMLGNLTALRAQLEGGNFQVVGQVPEGGDAVTRLTQWLAEWPGPRVANVPNVSSR